MRRKYDVEDKNDGNKMGNRLMPRKLNGPYGRSHLSAAQQNFQEIIQKTKADVLGQKSDYSLPERPSDVRSANVHSFLSHAGAEYMNFVAIKTFTFYCSSHGMCKISIVKRRLSNSRRQRRQITT